MAWEDYFQPFDFSGLPDQSYDFSGLPDETESWKPSRTPTWSDWFIENAASTVPPMVGGALGSLVGPGGTIAGGAAGGFLGENLREWYDISQGLREKYNPYQVLTQTALGGIPIPGKYPGAGATVEELLKYANWAPFKGAGYGGLLGAGGTVASNLAETGELPSWEQLGKGTGSGALFGAGTGLALGTAPSWARAQRIFKNTEVPDYPIPPTPRGLGGFAEPPPTQTPDFTTGPPPPVEAQPGIRIAGLSDTPDPRVVTIKSPDAATVTYWRNKGYVSVPGLRSPEGYAQMVRGDLGPLYNVAEGTPIQQTQQGPDIAAQTPIPQQPPRTDLGDVMGPDEVPYYPDQDITLSNVDVTPEVIQNFDKEGIKLVEQTPDGKSIFRRLIEDEEGGSDIELRLIKWATDKFRQLTGRDPNPQELENEIKTITRAQGPMPGETTGQVAPFEKPDLTFPFNNQDLLNQYLNLSERLDTWPRGVERRPDLADNANRMQAELIRRGWNPQTGQFPTSSTDTTPYSDKLGLTTRPTPQFQPGDLVRRKSTGEIGRITPSPEELQRMSSEELGTYQYKIIKDPHPTDPAGDQTAFKEIDAELVRRKTLQDQFTGISSVARPGPRNIVPGQDLAVPPELGQGELPGLLGGLGPQNRLENISNAQPPTGPVDLGPQLTQESFNFPSHNEPPAGYPREFSEDLMNELGGQNLTPVQEPAPFGPNRTVDLPPEYQQGGSRYQGDDGPSNMARQRVEQMYGPGEFRKKLETIPRMSIKMAAKTAAQYDEMLRGIDPSRVNTIRQLTEIRDLAQARAEGRIDSTWGQARPEKISVTDRFRAQSVGVNPDEHMTLQELNDAIEKARGEIEPSNMKVPGTNKQTGRPNIAVGPQMEDTSILDMLGTALYTRDRPATVAKELLQNADDELRISGNQGPIRVAFRYNAMNPDTGELVHSVVMQDSGRGMGPDALYTIFTDVGKSGKRDVTTAAGGFGFAKAAPLLGGEYVRIASTVAEGRNKIVYTFEGNPQQLKNQQVGVPLQGRRVDPNTPTGFRAEVFFPNDVSLSSAGTLVNQTVENTPHLQGVQVLNDYSTLPDNYEQFIEHGTLPPYAGTSIKTLNGQPIPSVKGVLNTPAATVDIHFDLDDKIRTNGDIVYLNNGLFALSNYVNYGQIEMPHVPEKIVANIKSLVKEGETGYPFGLNREELNRVLEAEIKKWIRENVTKAAERIRIAELQKVFDNLVPRQGQTFVVHDSGNRYTPDELNRFHDSPHMQATAGVMKDMLDRLDYLFSGPDGQLGKTTKFGFYLADIGSGGINIPSPNSPTGAREFANLVNSLGLMLDTETKMPLPPDEAAERIAHAILHEFNHNRARSEGGAFTWKLLETDSAYGTLERSHASKAILTAITGPNGDYAPGVLELLQDYQAARGRPDVTIDALSRQRASEWLKKSGQEGVPSSSRVSRGESPQQERGIINEIKDTLRRAYESERGAISWKGIKQATGWGMGGVGKTPSPKFDKIRDEILGLSRASTTVGDLSYTIRQAATHVFTPRFWTAFLREIQGGSSERAFQRIDQELRSKPIAIRTRNTRTGKLNPSYMDKIGFPMLEMGTNLPARAQQIQSNWIETGGMFGSNNPVQRMYQRTLGNAARASNRAFTTMANHLGVNQLETLLNRARDLSQEALATGKAPLPGIMGGVRVGGVHLGFKGRYNQQEAEALDPYKNLMLGREIAEMVLTTLGRAPLKMHYLPFNQTELNLEFMAKGLVKTFFAPGLMASRMRMLYPATYMMASPGVRKGYLKAGLSSAIFWLGMTGLMAGLASSVYGRKHKVSVETDMRSSDFGKIRIGNTRLDFGQGFQQYLVLVNRWITGEYKSSATSQVHKYGVGFQAETQLGQTTRFLTNKLEPYIKFVTDLADASDYKPFHVMDRTLQLFTPLAAQDLWEIMKEDPSLVPLMGPVILGAGTQTYEKGEATEKLIPKEYDWVIKGGGFKHRVDELEKMVGMPRSLRPFAPR